MHFVPMARDLAFPRAGSSIPARIAMMAITTSNSMSVNPRWERGPGLGRSRLHGEDFIPSGVMDRPPRGQAARQGGCAAGGLP